MNENSFHASELAAIDAKLQATSSVGQSYRLENWMKLPEEQTHEFKWYLPYLLYKRPFALGLQEWSKFHAHIKSEHPVQYFFRETLNDFYYASLCKFSQIFRGIKSRIRNPRAEMRKAVFPPYYRDLDKIIEHFHFEVIKEFVDREKCFEGNCYITKEQKKFKKELLAHYRYVTKNRQELSDKLFFSKKPLADPITLGFGFNPRSEELLKQKDESLAIWVIQNRNQFWT